MANQTTMLLIGFTGRELAESAFKDLESFFFHSSRFTVRREFDASVNGHASLKGSGVDTRIALSKDLCDHRHESISDYIFTLLIISHELAHFLNYHNFHYDLTPGDTVALEARADNFGAQVFATIMTFGKKTQRNMLALSEKLEQKNLTEAIGQAIGRLYAVLYTPGFHSKYPNPVHRAFATISGLLSFLTGTSAICPKIGQCGFY